MSELTSMKDFQKKYRKNIEGIAAKQGVDTGVAADMFVRNLRGEGTFAGGGRLDFNEPIRDYNQLRKDLLLKDELAREQPETKPLEPRRPLQRREALTQAERELRPGFERAVGQLQEQVAATRQAIPQQLAARGQALGGMRTAQEMGLTREEAFRTADIRAQQAMAEQQRATELVAQREAQIAQEQARQEALRQQEFQNQMAIRSAELQEQGMTADQAFRQAQFEFQQTQAGQEQAFRQQQLAEQQRQFGLEFGLRQQQAEAQAAQLAAQRPDLSNYINASLGLQGQARIDYINNLQTRGLITTEDANQIKGMTGVTPEVVGEIAPPATGRMALPGETGVVAPEAVIGYQPPTAEDAGLGLDIRDYQSTIQNQFAQYNQFGDFVGYDYPAIQSYIQSVAAVDPLAAQQLGALYPDLGQVSPDKQQAINIIQQAEAGALTEEQADAQLQAIGAPTDPAELDAWLSQ